MTTDVDQQESLEAELAEQYDSNVPEAEETAVEDTPEVSDEPTAQEVQEAIEALEPPPKWKKEAKNAFEEWAKQDDEGNPLYPNGSVWQQHILDLYNEGQGYTTQVEQERAQLRQHAEQLHNQAQQWNGVLAPYQQLVAEWGVTPDVAVRQAMGFMQSLRNNPQATMQRLARESGLDLNTLANGQEWQSPEAKEIENLKRQMRSQEQARLQQEQQAHQNRIHAIQQENAQQIHAFATATDDNGDLLHPHLETVESTMAQLVHGHNAMNQNTPPDLEAIYQHACSLNPEIAQADAAKAEADRLAKANAEAKKAANAAKRVKTNTAGKEMASQSLEDELSELYDKRNAA